MRIDQIMDANSDHKLLSFMDTFLGSKQIHITLKDEEKITFITDQGLYCYKVMPFRLKNTKATYQCLINKVFKNQINCYIEIYIDNILAKSIEVDITSPILKKSLVNYSIRWSATLINVPLV